MYYKLDGEEDGEPSYEHFIKLLIKELQVKRVFGYVRLSLYGKKEAFQDQYISILIRKRDLYVLGVNLDNKVYELGIPEEGNEKYRRYFFGSILTDFGEQYSELFPNIQDFEGIELGYEVLHNAIQDIIREYRYPWLWRRSIGVFALMWSECARFVWFQDVLFVVMRNKRVKGDERWAPLTLRGSIRMDLGQYEFMSKLPLNWRNISECARGNGDYTILYDDNPQPDNEKYTEAGIENLKRNPGWAKDSLSILTWKEDEPDKSHHPGYGDGGGGYLP